MIQKQINLFIVQQQLGICLKSPHMNNQKIKTVCQSTLLLKQQQHTLIEYAHIFNNHVFIYDTYINFNGENINNDRNSKAQFAIFTNDGAYIFIAMSRPNAISVLNTRTGDLLVARELEQISNKKIIAFSMQPEQHISSQRKGKKLYFIYEERGSLMLKLIQIENQIDNNPKTRTKVIQQNISQGSNIFRFQPIFCNLSWSTFIIFKKEFRVFMIKKEGQQLGMNFTVQSFQPNLLRLTSSFNVLGFAQSPQTWAILCGNPINSRNTSQLSLNIFWQHKERNQLCRNLYFRDNSFIKSLSLPIHQEQYVRIWQVNGYYLIQSRNRRNGIHKCCIVHEDQNSANIITLDLLQGSKLCERTLEITPQHIAVCQIKNKFELYQTKIYEKEVGREENIRSNEPNTNSTRANTQVNNSDDIERNKSKQSTQTVRTEQNIKKFTPTSQTIVNPQIKEQVRETKKVLSGQISKKDVILPKNTTFINQKIVQHLNKNEKKGNESDAEIQAPNSVQRLVSFGTPNNLTQQKKPQNHNISFGAANQTLKQNAAISFGNQKLTPDAQIAEKSNTVQNVVEKQKPNVPVQSDDEMKEKIKNHKEKYAQVKGQIQKMQESLCKQLENKKLSLKENYLTISESLKMNLETIFTPSEQQSLKRQLSCLGQFTPIISKQKKKNEMLDIEIKNSQLFIQQCKQLLNKFGLWKQKQQTQLASFRKFIKSTKKEVSLQSKILSNLEIIKDSYVKLQKDTNQAYQRWKQEEKKRSIVKKQYEKSQKISMKQIFHFINGEKIKQSNKKQKCLKIPICKVEWIRQIQPQIILSPLQR